MYMGIYMHTYTDIECVIMYGETDIHEYSNMCMGWHAARMSTTWCAHMTMLAHMLRYTQARDSINAQILDLRTTSNNTHAHMYAKVIYMCIHM